MNNLLRFADYRKFYQRFIVYRLTVAKSAMVWLVILVKLFGVQIPLVPPFLKGDNRGIKNDKKGKLGI